MVYENAWSILAEEFKLKTPVPSVYTDLNSLESAYGKLRELDKQHMKDSILSKLAKYILPDRSSDKYFDRELAKTLARAKKGNTGISLLYVNKNRGEKRVRVYSAGCFVPKSKYTDGLALHELAHLAAAEAYPNWQPYRSLRLFFNDMLDNAVIFDYTTSMLEEVLAWNSTLKIGDRIDKSSGETQRTFEHIMSKSSRLDAKTITEIKDLVGENTAVNANPFEVLRCNSEAILKIASRNMNNYLRAKKAKLNVDINHCDIQLSRSMHEIRKYEVEFYRTISDGETIRIK